MRGIAILRIGAVWGAWALAPACQVAPMTGTPDLQSAPSCPPPGCMTGLGCLNVAEVNGASTFSLRMVRLVMRSPVAATQGVAQMIVQDGATPDLPDCNVNGGDYLIWLMQFDTNSRTGRTGIATPLPDDRLGYRFLDRPLADQQGTAYDPRPYTFFNTTIGQDGSFDTGAAGDILVPIFLDRQATSFLPLPLHGLRLTGHLSPDHDCIGSYDSVGLSAVGMGVSDAANPAFITGGNVSAYIKLDEADSVNVIPFGMSLCAFLTGTSMAGNPIRCARDMAGKILAHGDWCSTTNLPGNDTCQDAFRLIADFAASALYVRD